MQVWSECVSRVPQPSNHLAGGDSIAYLDDDRALLHVHHYAVFGTAMVNDDAIACPRHSRVMQCVVQTSVLSRLRVVGYIIACVSHGSSRRRYDLAAPARSRRVLAGAVFLFCIVLIQTAHIDSKVRAIDAAMGSAMTAVGGPVLPNNGQTTKGTMSDVFCW